MWPPKILALFDAANWDSSDESELFGPYNALLDFCFPWEEGWSIAPQYSQPTKGDDTHFTTVFLVARKKVPVFILQIKPASHIHHTASREAADKQMREILIGLLSAVQLPTLHGFSALGSRLSHYKPNTSTSELSPKGTFREPECTPAHAWCMNVLQDEGERQFRGITQDVKSMASNLAAN